MDEIDTMDDSEYKWRSADDRTLPFPPTSGQKCFNYCLTFIMTMLILLIILFLAAAGVFYWYILVYRGADSNIYIEVLIRVTLDMDFIDEFNNPSSDEYKNLTASYENEIDDLWKNSNWEETYLQTNVVSLSQGSVLADSLSYLKDENKVDQKNSSERISALEDLREEIEAFMQNEISNGVLGDYLPVKQGSFVIVGTPAIVDEIRVIAVTTPMPTNAMTTTRSPTTSTTTTRRPTTARRTMTPPDCQSPGDILLLPNTPYDLFSPNFPANYPPNTFCMWQIRAPANGQRIRAHFNFVYLEDGVDFLHVGTGPGEGEYNMLSYTGTTEQVPLDVISPGTTLVITFESSANVGSQGFSMRFDLVEAPGDDHVTCDNGLEVLVADDICDSRVECNDGSDETDCYDLLRTGICGTSTGPITRILGGQEISLGSMPWMGSVRTATGAHYCGASLLSEQWAITAAHCVPLADHVIFGGISLDTPSDYEEKISISAIFAHPGYNLTTGNPDVALIRLARPVKISEAIRPVCVAHVTDDVDEADIYTDCRALGWGAPHTNNGGLSPVLKQVSLPLIPRDECTALTDDDSSYTKICAGNTPNSDTCTGDNGGPLVCRGPNNLWHLLGVTTRSSHCMPSATDVYTRVSALHGFILYTVTQTDACIGGTLETFCLDQCVGGDDCRTQCSEDEAKCGVGNCIDESKTCDGIADCIDASDEGAAQNCDSDGCGGEIIFPPDSLLVTYTITSPGYPSSYKSLQRCQWTISTVTGYNIRLKFTDFATERGYDIVYIENSNSEPMLALSGDYMQLDVLSTSNNMAIIFESDYAMEMRGFSLEATSISENEVGTLTTCSNGMQIIPDPQDRVIMCNGIPECFDNSDETQCACESSVRNLPLNGFEMIQSQSFGSVGYPDFPIPCQWTVHASSSDRRLEVAFLEFKTESGYDFLSFTDGTGDSAITVSYSGHNSPPTLVTTGSMVLISFTSDHTGGAKGFQMRIADITTEQANGQPKCGNSFEALDPVDSCDGIEQCSDGSDEGQHCHCGDFTLLFISDGSSIDHTSARYPSNYFHNMDCSWLASLENEQQRLRIHFNDFSLEDGEDFLNIGDFSYTGSTLPLDIVLSNHDASISFTTDGSISSSGFSMTLSGIEATEANTYNYCDNGLEVLTGDKICNDVIECSDGSDEDSCGS